MEQRRQKCRSRGDKVVVITELTRPVFTRYKRKEESRTWFQIESVPWSWAGRRPQLPQPCTSSPRAPALPTPKSSYSLLLLPPAPATEPSINVGIRRFSFIPLRLELWVCFPKESWFCLVVNLLIKPLKYYCWNVEIWVRRLKFRCGPFVWP